ncbi:hypothetical protein VTL71DRAFT_1098 [Oculimacula yallundae]|uniref:G domain-containing protein n=1 Tax=Oculimacula yallundae TaxID=86028 RepID=A0ABR4D225_9HELO
MRPHKVITTVDSTWWLKSQSSERVEQTISPEALDTYFVATPDFGEVGSSRSLITELERPDIVIAVMGVTGVGKSSFIEVVTGEKNIVGHDLQSATSEVKTYRFSHKSVNYVLVDTPGFDDSTMTDQEVTQKILLWLRSSYSDGTFLQGIIYIHRIKSPRMQGSAMKNMRIFRKLCGDAAFGNVLLATTFWDMVTQSEGEARELELKNSKEFWADMIAKGSEVVRIDYRKNRPSCMQILELIAAKNHVELAVQKDLTIEVDTGPEEIRQAKKTADKAKKTLVSTLHRRIDDAKRVATKAMKEERKLAKARQRELNKRSRNAEKAHNSQMKDDEQEMRRERQGLWHELGLRYDLEGGQTPTHARYKWSIPRASCWAATCFWNIFITALLGSVINDSFAGTPAQINFCMFVVVVCWLSRILSLVNLIVEGRISRFALLIVDAFTTLVIFIAAVVLSGKLGVHSCFNEVKPSFRFCEEIFPVINVLLRKELTFAGIYYQQRHDTRI